jgi:hypothetical protein
MRARRSPTSGAGLLVAATVLAGGALVGGVPGTAQAVDPPAVTVSVTVSMTTDLDPAGETITVTGTGFDPAANTGTRPPLAGQPSGVYVVFGAVTEPWRPSQGGTSGNRVSVSQVWALPQASYDALGGAGTPGLALLQPDGSFSVTLEAAESSSATGSYGVYTYAGGGAVNADQETFTATSFLGSTPPPTSAPPTSAPSTSAPSTSAPPTGPSQVTGGSLTWGVKASFRSYVTGPIAAGTVTTGQGVIEQGVIEQGAVGQGANGTGPYVFPGATGTADLQTSEISAQYGGTVAFVGHAGALDLTFANPRVEVGSAGAVLVVDVTTRTPGSAPVTTPDVALADLALGQPAFANGVLTWTDLPATLTEDGEEAFGGFYEAGTALDPVSLVVALDGATVPAPSASPTTPSPTSPAPAPGKSATLADSTVGAGDAMTVTVPAGTFTPEETVLAEVRSTPIPVGSAVADAAGGLSFRFALPSALPAGQHSVVLTGQTSGVQASAAFTLATQAAGAALAETGFQPGILFGGTGMVVVGTLLLLAARRRQLAGQLAQD